MDRHGRPRDRHHGRDRHRSHSHRSSPDRRSHAPGRPSAGSSQHPHYENPRRVNKRRIGEQSEYQRQELARLNLQPPSKRARPNDYDPRAQQAKHRPQRPSNNKTPEYRLQALPISPRRPRPNAANIVPPPPPPRPSHGRDVRNNRDQQARHVSRDANRNGNANRNTSRPKGKTFEVEKDFHRITQRMRQIDIGKATPEYRNYTELVPRHERKPHHPRTPNPRHKMPNKWWKTAINRWRKALHAFDDEALAKHKKKKQGAQTKDKAPSKAETDGSGEFCCEKCAGTFEKFDEWMRHREQCDGTAAKKEDDQDQKQQATFDDDDEDEDFDLFHLNPGADLDVAKAEKKAAVAPRDDSELSSPEIYEGSDDHEDDDGLMSKLKPDASTGVATLSLLDQLNNVLDEDNDGLL